MAGQGRAVSKSTETERNKKTMEDTHDTNEKNHTRAELKIKQQTHTQPHTYFVHSANE